MLQWYDSTMRTLVWAVLLASLVGCVGEWDIPKTPRRDPCTHEVEDKYVYVAPVCPSPPARNPRDLDHQDPTYGR